MDPVLSGGFSLYAARGGAKFVTDLDISAYALESAKRSFALNQSAAGVKACRHETIQTRFRVARTAARSPH